MSFKRTMYRAMEKPVPVNRIINPVKRKHIKRTVRLVHEQEAPTHPLEDFMKQVLQIGGLHSQIDVQFKLREEKAMEAEKKEKFEEELKNFEPRFPEE
jgi:hypothetical protein